VDLALTCAISLLFRDLYTNTRLSPLWPSHGGRSEVPGKKPHSFQFVASIEKPTATRNKGAGLFDEAVWSFVEHLFTAFRTEVVGLTLVLARPLSGFLIHIHPTYKILGHNATSRVLYRTMSVLIRLWILSRALTGLCGLVAHGVLPSRRRDL
jgi:hypothetical protein